MTNLSPSAQAVLDAYGDFEAANTDAMAAALRAVADQWKNEIRKQSNTEFISGIKNCIDALNELADELEGVTYGTYRCDLEDK
jgi:Zn-dependent oligopeptidase